MADYRDIGRLDGYSSTAQLVNTNKRGLVYLATHIGEQTLPYMYRSFISFTYGGKKIEDFNLISTISGDRLNRKGYAEFEDTVTTYDNLDGQYYWATHYKNNQMDFVLSTDGIDQKLLDEFLYWFKPGIYRELILAEHPNRGIMARIATPPELNLLPFEGEVTIRISSLDYTTKTTLYKGDITISFTMDLPHWYSILNILGKKVTESGKTRYVDLWHDVLTDSDISIFASLDALKILYEDGIPLGSMIDSSMLLGNGSYATVEDRVENIIWNPSHATLVDHILNPLPGIADPTTGGGACIQGMVNNVAYYGSIAGAIVDADGKGIVSLPSGTSSNSGGFFFYSGTAPAPVILSFGLKPRVSGYYIIEPKNIETNSDEYNVITIESLHKLELRLTTPNVYTSYNKALDIFAEMTGDTTYDWEDIRKELRDKVRHAGVRAWAIKIIDSAEIDTVTSRPSTSALSRCLSYFFCNSSGEILPATYTFNSETGEAVATFKYRKVPSGGTIPSVRTGQSAWLTYGLKNNSELYEIEEDVGDMLKSNYIIILDRNYATDDGNVTRWRDGTDKERQYSHRITHDFTEPLTNLTILYKNMYL